MNVIFSVNRNRGEYRLLPTPLRKILFLVVIPLLTVIFIGGEGRASAAVAVSTPYAGESVSSPFRLQANATACGTQATSAMGYSFDDNSQTTTVNGSSIDAMVSAKTGAHILHVKCWGVSGAAGVSDVSITVAAAPSTPPRAPAPAVTVSSPFAGATVSSPFRLQANANTCGSQATSAMGYSFDDSPQSTIVNGSSINAMIPATGGAHVLHVKCWGSSGGAGASDLRINVTNGPAIPANAKVVNNIQQLQSWVTNHDPGTGAGSTAGATQTTNTPTLSGQSRRYEMAYQNSGGQIFHTTFGIDTSATNFVYDTQLYISGSAQGIGNIEMDLNQVMANGQTVIYGFQCDGYTGTWDYTINAGTPTAYDDQWVHSTTPCPAPKTWATNTWHHVQIVLSRDTAGKVTYHEAWLDGVQYPLQNATGNSAFALGWGSVLLTNFQIDGLGKSGTATVYADNMTVYRW